MKPKYEVQFFENQKWMVRETCRTLKEARISLMESWAKKKRIVRWTGRVIGALMLLACVTLT